MTLRFISLLSLLTVTGLSTLQAQIQLPYVEDFSGLDDSTYTNPTTVPGLENVRFSGTWNVGHQDTLDSTYVDVLSIKETGQGGDSLIFTLDLSAYDAEVDELIVILEMAHAFNYRSDWTLSVREHATSAAVIVSQFSPTVGTNHLVFRELSSKLQAQGQQYGPEFQIILRLAYQGYTTGGTEYYLDRFSVGFAPQADVALSKLTAPEPEVQFESADKVSLEITNYGKNAISSVPVSYIVADEAGNTTTYSEVLAMTLEPNVTGKITSSIDMEFSSRGVSIITAALDLDTDSLPQNNTASGVTFRPDVYTASLPFVESFENTTLAPYTQYAASIDPLSGISYWSDSKNGRLEVRDGKLVVTGTGFNYLTSDLFVTLDIGDDDPADLVMEMEYSYGGILSQNDCKVYVRGSDDDEWVEVMNWRKYQPLSDTKTAVEFLPLSILLASEGQAPTSSFQVKFTVIPYGSSGYFFLNSIGIRPRPGFELKLLSVSPQPEGGLNTHIDTLTATVVNLGTVSRTDVPISLRLESSAGESTVTQAVAGTLLPLDTTQVTFVNPFDLSAPGNYEISCYLSATDEVNRENDSLAFQTYTLSVSTEPLPYFEDFSAFSAQAYTAKSGLIEDRPGYSYLKEGSGNILITDSYGFRSDHTSVEIENKNSLILTMNLSGYDTLSDELYLDFAYELDIVLYSDVLPVQIRGDVGQNWIPLTNLYPDLQRHGDEESELYETWYRRIGISLTDTLRKAKQNFSAHTQIRFSGPGAYGFHVNYDDITIYQKESGVNLEAWSLLVPGSFLETPASEEIKVKIINRGEVSAESITLSLSVITPAGNTLSQEYPIEGIQLAPGDTLVYPLTNPFDLSADGEYQFIASVDNQGDINPFDNHVEDKIINRTVVTELPYSIDIPGLVDEVVYTFGEFTQIPGLYVTSATDYMSVKKQSFFNARNDSTFTALGANYGVRFGGEQSFTLTFDLSHLTEKDTARLNIHYYLSYFPTDNGVNDGLYIRGSAEEEWVKILAHGTNSFRYREVEESRNLTDYLYPNGQSFTSTTQVKVVATSGYYYVQFNLISFELRTAVWTLSVPKLADALIYPNPTGDWVTITHKQPSSIEILDLAGRVLLRTDLEAGSSQLSLRHLNEGIYLVNLSFQDGGKTTQRILIQR